jgi:glycosyltransferase involved in cell wall biosynthesis
VALNLVREQRALGIDARIWCLDSPAEVSWALQSSGLEAEHIIAFPHTGPTVLEFSTSLDRAVTGPEGRSVDVIHQHGIWTGISRATNSWRGRFGRPTVLAPHGALEAWAVQRSVWKKRLARIAYENRNFRETACFHATALPEAEEFRRYGVRRPVAVISNGLSNAWTDSEGHGSRFRVKCGLPAGARVLLYVGRVTPVKNLEMLVAAMAVAMHTGDLHGWLLVVVGADEFGYQRKLEQLAGQLAIKRFVRFVGFVEQEYKRDAFAAASAFVLPSRKEASPISVLDALGAAIPVLTTRGTPWQELETHQCGWWCDVNVESIGRALGEVLRASPGHLADMGERGRQLVREKYMWSASAASCVDLYQWLMGASARPGFVTES